MSNAELVNKQFIIKSDVQADVISEDDPVLAAMYFGIRPFQTGCTMFTISVYLVCVLRAALIV
jgi:hypothetical protein